ncbi:transglutaminase domain-containing protein [Bremerella cremea]|uniref:Transglutaminase domain-containing protein n=2 Tax=Bremerella cremea TaxID=1031537 RepID=A0A368KVK5_9BACT|nr:transglutaminase domain-containing protein [Bremerella cremea]
MVLTSALGLQLAISHGELGYWWQWLEVALVGAVAWLCARYMAPSDPIRDKRVMGLLLAVVAGHFVMEQVLYQTMPRAGQLFEGQMSLSLRNLMIASLAFRAEKRIANLATLTSLALMAVSVFMSVYWSVTICGIVYAVLGVGYLVTSYWERISGRFPEGTKSEIPRGAVGLAFCLAVFLAAAAIGIAGTNHATRALAGFMPSSGGNQISDSRSQGGVGDGDDLVQGTKDAMSFGPTESEVFLESKMPSLFDVFNDTYDAPIVKKTARQKAVSLPRSEMEHRHSRVATTKSKGNDFSLLRKNEARRQKSLDDKKSPALFYVKGRVPLHLRTTIYDHFDGVNLQAAESHQEPPIKLIKENGVPWYHVSCPLSDEHIHSTEEHLLKFINLKTDRIPAPARLARFQIKDVDREEMFGLATDGHPRITVDFIPQLTVMRVQSSLVSSPTLLGDYATSKFRQSISVPDHEASIASIRELAHEWTSDLPPGWQQIAAVRDRLRSEYKSAPNSQLSEEVEFPVESFLLETKQGPDYLFATATSLLLRELGYSSRVVSGFYADPQNFDVGTWQTPVFKDNVHFWVEVSWDGKVWHPVEPTPGYELLAPRLTPWQRLHAVCLAAGKWCVSNWIPLSIGAVLMVAVCALFKRLADVVLRLANRYVRFGSERNRVLWTAKLMQWRARLQGRRRPQGQTFTKWIQECSQPISPEFIAATNWALYSPTLSCPLSHAEIGRVCDEAFTTLVHSPSLKNPASSSKELL